LSDGQRPPEANRFRRPDADMVRPSSEDLPDATVMAPEPARVAVGLRQLAARRRRSRWNVPPVMFTRPVTLKVAPLIVRAASG